MASPRVGAVLPAAGRARRFGSGENKIWATLAGRTVLERTLSAFTAHPAIASIVVVAGAEELERVEAAARAFSTPITVVVGGETRAESVRRGLDALPADTEFVLVHDAARPLISSELIDRIIAAADRAGASVPGLTLSDTVKRVDAAGFIRATIPRTETVDGETLAGLTAVQTPQGARLSLLRSAYRAYDFAHREPTDEASLIEAFGAPIAVVPGDARNIKITRREDIVFAERLFAERLLEAGAEPARARPAEEADTEMHAGAQPEVRTGFGYDVHAFAEPDAGRKLFLGGVEIPHDRGLDGHSDADVLLHAVCDALLGAASLGDIGILFPNTDEAYRGISSLKLLEVVRDRIAEAGWQVVNIDATLVAEAPKLMPHRLHIQATIAHSLGLSSDRVSVKATTSEKMGFVGREEGMACWAVATVRSRARAAAV